MSQLSFNRAIELADADEARWGPEPDYDDDDDIVCDVFDILSALPGPDPYPGGVGLQVDLLLAFVSRLRDVQRSRDVQRVTIFGPSSRNAARNDAGNDARNDAEAARPRASALSAAGGDP